MSGSIAASGFFCVREHYTIVEKTIIKSMERGWGKSFIRKFFPSKFS